MRMMATDALRECLCHASTDPVRQATDTPAPRRVVPAAVTFGQFARGGRRLGWSIDFLVRMFRGRIDEPRDLFERIFDRHDRHAAMLLPYATVLAFYHRETTAKRTRPRRKSPEKVPAVATSFLQKSGEHYPVPTGAVFTA
jgi:hypothetical protein